MWIKSETSETSQQLHKIYAMYFSVHSGNLVTKAKEATSISHYVTGNIKSLLEFSMSIFINLELLIILEAVQASLLKKMD